MTKEEKLKALRMLTGRKQMQYDQLTQIEPRLAAYYNDLCTHPEFHNGNELLGALKLLRLLRTYVLDLDTLRDVIYKYEGTWRDNGGIWEHLEGGVRHPGTTGPTYYRLQPFQVFVLVAMFGLKAWINTEAEAGSRALLPTEEVRDGKIYDLRRLCTEFTDFTPRKTAKTQLSAFIGFLYFMQFDDNNEVYCCANALDQSKILYGRIYDLVRQMDPKEKRIRFTKSQINWKPGQFRSAICAALSAGGKTKDGLFAGACLPDEFGSAPYVNGSSDMGKLVSVVESSMGPRREPMTFISTTAGIIQEGPFIDKLAGIKALLLTELDPDYRHDLSNDRQMCLLLEPDEWEAADEEILLTSKDVRRKINPMLGIIVQHSFYDDEIAKARQNPEKKIEVISKLFNVYQSGKVTSWIKGDRIRPLQIDRRITDCKWSEDWNVFVGMDFSGGDDLFAITYLAVRLNPETGNKEFFADFDAWILEAALKESPNRLLFEKWIEQGHLHLMPGEVFYNEQAIDALIAKNQQGINMVLFGYDPAQSIDPINNLKAWLQSLGIEPKTILSMVVPVRQHALAQNPSILELETLIKAPEQFIHFSNNPMWPWLFTNALSEKKNDLRRLTKGKPQDKIDPVAALINCVYLFDLANGNIQQ